MKSGLFDTNIMGEDYVNEVTSKWLDSVGWQMCTLTTGYWEHQNLDTPLNIQLEDAQDGFAVVRIDDYPIFIALNNRAQLKQLIAGLHQTPKQLAVYRKEQQNKLIKQLKQDNRKLADQATTLGWFCVIILALLVTLFVAFFMPT